MRKLFNYALALCACALVLTGCDLIGSPKDGPLKKTFNGDGITLSYPSNYKITDEDHEDGVYTFCCERKGLDNAMLTFMCIDEEESTTGMDEQSICELYMEQVMDGMGIFEGSLYSVSRGSLTTGSMGDYDCYLLPLAIKVLGTPQDAYVKAFRRENGQTWVVFGMYEMPKYGKTLDAIEGSVVIE